MRRSGRRLLVPVAVALVMVTLMALRLGTDHEVIGDAPMVATGASLTAPAAQLHTLPKSTDPGDAGAMSASLPSRTKHPLLPFPLVTDDGLRLPPELAEGGVDPRPWLVVGGIPTVDTDVGRQRRDRQRSSWLRYSGVVSGVNAVTATSPSSMMLVRYILGRHPSREFRISADLRSEASEHHDILVFDVREGRGTGKKSGGVGYWGPEAEVGMSRKAFAWFASAGLLYPSARYFMKGDDDVFLRVPQYLFDLSSRIQAAINSSATGQPLYWGKTMRWGAKKGDPKSTFYFVGGMSITLDRSLADVVAVNNRFDLLRRPFVEDRMPDYKSFNMDHEDVMIGRLFYDTKTPLAIARDCRFHDIHVGANVKPVTDRSVAVHHLTLEEYDSMMRRFPDIAVGGKVDASKLRVSPYHVPPGSFIIDMC